MYAEVSIAKKEKKWVIKEHALIGFNRKEIEKHRTAQRMLEEVVNSWEFRQELLAMSLTSTGGIQNTKIYNRIINGNEDLSQDIDNEADIYVHAYNRPYSNVVGYTYPHTEKTWVNLKFFNSFDYPEVAENLFHEWLHKLGFDHAHSDEKTSVPYAVGGLVKRLVKHLMNGGILHDVNSADKEIDIILGSTIPSKPIPKELVCFRSWKNLWRKQCYYQ